MPFIYLISFLYIRLQEFEFRDDSGGLQPLNFMDLSGKPLFISGNIHPSEGLVTKKSGREVASFGPVAKWDVVYSKDDAKVGAYA